MVKELDPISQLNTLDTPVSRRKLLTLAGQGGLGLLLAACAGAVPTATPTRAPAATPTPTPRPVKTTLTVVFPVLTTQVDAHVASGKDFPVVRNIYERPAADFYSSEEFGVKNQLAKDISVDADGNVVMKLREGVKFHGGETLTADDIKFNVDRMQDPATKAWFALRFNKDIIQRVEVVDPLTAKFVVNKPPKPKLLVDMFRLFIMPRSWTQAHTPEYFVNNTNGTGPFKLLRFVPEQVAELEAFDQWWGGKIPFKKLVIQFNNEEATRLATLQRGEADIMYGLTPDLAQVAEGAGLDVLVADSKGPGLISMYNLSPNNPVDPGQPNPLRDVRVRQACNYAVNRELIIKSILRGYGKPMNSWIPSPTLRGYVPPDQLTPFGYNPDKAKQLLREAGYATGFKNKIHVPEGSYIKGKEIAEAVAAQLSEVGIKTTVEVLPYSIFVDRIRTQKLEPMHLDLGFGAPVDPWSLPDSFLHYLKWFEDDELEKTFQDTFKLSVEEQNAGLLRLTKQAWEKAPVIWLWHQALIWAASRQVQWTPAGYRDGADYYGAKPR